MSAKYANQDIAKITGVSKLPELGKPKFLPLTDTEITDAVRDLTVRLEPRILLAARRRLYSGLVFSLGNSVAPLLSRYPATSSFMNAIRGKIFASIGWFVLFAVLTVSATSSLNFEYNPVGSTLGLVFWGGLSLAWLWLAWKTLKGWISVAVATAVVGVLLLAYSGMLWLTWMGQRS